MKIHIVSHTHWDREWYRSFSYFDTRLSYFFDKLFKTIEDEDYKNFLLDGQMVMVEDYLQLHPQNKNKIIELVKSGKLIIGPWYSQPDEFAPDGESLIRNLLIGINMAKNLGDCMLVGYLPDSFGHNGQIPQILKGFNIHSAVVMRGVPVNKLNKNEFIWQGINKDQVLAVSLTKGYSNGMFLPKDIQGMSYRIQKATEDLVKTGSSDYILILNGVDHQFPQPQITDFIKNVQDKNNTYVHSTLESYINDISKSKSELQTIAGELISPVTNRVHTSIASTRMYQKTKNRHIETLLEKKVEPIVTLAWLYGAKYPIELINKSWKLLLKNQIHDSICGCCTDEVHEDIDHRFSEIESTCNTLLKVHSRAIASQVSGKGLSLLVFNDSMIKTKQIVYATIYVENDTFTLFDEQQREVDYVIENKEIIDAASLSIWTLYLGTKCMMNKVEISFEVDFDFDYGYKMYNIKEETKLYRGIEYKEINTNILENKFSKIIINENGTFDLFDKETSHQFKQLNRIEDCGDAGDTYNYSPVEKDTIINSNSVTKSEYVVKQSLNKTIAIISYDLYLPFKLSEDEKTRIDNLIKQKIEIKIILYNNIKRIDVQTTINNDVLDHRLRVVFPTGLKSDFSSAEIQFGTIKRPNTISESENWIENKLAEKPLPIYSHQKFVDVSDDNMGLSIMNRGLTEYEIYENKTSDIALTLLRGVGFLGKPDLLIRPGRASGMPIATPKAQCLGKTISEYSILVHKGTVDDAKIANYAAAYNANSTVVQNRLKHSLIEKNLKQFFDIYDIESLQENITEKIQNYQKGSNEFIKIDSESLIISAIKKAEKEDALIIRIYNSIGSISRPAEIKINVDINKVFECDLLENSTNKIQSRHDIFMTNKINGYSIQSYKITLKS